MGAPSGAPAARVAWKAATAANKPVATTAATDGQLHGGLPKQGQRESWNAHWSGVPDRTDCTTSRMAWVDVSASAPVMSESCVAVAMTR